MISNLLGKTFGRLKVIEQSNYKNPKKRGVHWKVLCSCGKELILIGSTLTTGHTKSCGCLKKDVDSSKKVLNAELNKYYGFYKRGAMKRDLEFSLTKEQFSTLCKKNCVYCNASPSKIFYLGRDVFEANGLDRVDNNFGYTLVNSVPCCKICNSMKSKLSLSEFRKQIERIYLNSVKDDK